MEELTSEQLRSIAGQAIRDRVRSAVKEALEQILEEEMTEHLGAGRRERNVSRTGERNGSYSRDLITPVGKIEQLRVPRDRDGTFATQVFEEYRRTTGEVEDAILEMWLQGISQRKIAEVTAKLGAVRIGKGAYPKFCVMLPDSATLAKGRRWTTRDSQRHLPLPKRAMLHPLKHGASQDRSTCPKDSHEKRSKP